MNHESPAAKSTMNQLGTPPATEPGVWISQHELDRLRALATLGELTGTATHEFNNILMTVMNYAKLAIRDRSDAGRDKALNKILDASQRAARISSTILAQARNRQDSVAPADLGELIGDTLELMSRELRKYRVDVQTTLEPDPERADQPAGQRPASDATGGHGDRVADGRSDDQRGGPDRPGFWDGHSPRPVAEDF